MPFTSSTSYRSREQAIGEIISVDAGDDQRILDNRGQLIATVNGSLFGRSIVWEQVAGGPVSFDGRTDELSVAFTQFTNDIKVFRFTVDKNLSTEIFDEVTIQSGVVSEGQLMTNGFRTSSVITQFVTTLSRLNTIPPTNEPLHHQTSQHSKVSTMRTFVVST